MSFPCPLHWQGIVHVGEHNVVVHRPLQDSRIARTAVEQTMSEACSNKHCYWHLYRKNMAVSCDLLKFLFVSWHEEGTVSGMETCGHSVLTQLQGVKSQNTWIFSNTAVRTWNLASLASFGNYKAVSLLQCYSSLHPQITIKPGDDANNI